MHIWGMGYQPNQTSRVLLVIHDDHNAERRDVPSDQTLY